MPSLSGSQKALMYSFSNTLRSGAGRSGYFPAIASFQIGGATITGAIKPSASISEEIDNVPNTARLALRSGPSYAAEVLADAPIGYWKLDEMTGATVAVDRSGNARNGTFTGTVTLGQTGPLSDGSKAALFDGSTGAVSLGSVSALDIVGTLTIEAWVKRTSTAFASILTDQQTPTNDVPYEFRLSNANPALLQLVQANGVTFETLNSSGTVSNNAFHHVAVTRSGTTVTFYIDGAAAGTATATLTPTASGTAAYIARRTDSITFFPGVLDEVAIYSTALSATRIAAHYAARLYTTSLLQAGNEIIIGLGNLTNRLFAGHILSTKEVARPLRDQKRPVVELECIDYSWQLDWKRVSGKSWTATSVSTIIGDILTAFAPAFTLRAGVGLGSTDFQSNHDERVSEAISRLMKMVGGYWYTDYDRVVHIFVTAEADANAVSLDSTNTKFWDFEYAEDVSQARTRTRVTGRASTTTGVAAVGDTVLAVDDTRLYSSSGGYALAGGNQITYTGKSTSTGPGNLTGIPAAGTGSILYAVAQGETVRVLAIQQSATAAGVIISQVGTGDGYIEHSIEDGQLGDSAANQAATGDLALNSSYDKRIGYKTRDLFTRPGKVISVDLTNAKTSRRVSGSFKVQRVTISDIEVARTRFPIRTVEAGANRQDLFLILGDVLEE